MTDLAKAQATLEAQLQELETRLSHIGRDLSEPHDPDSSERAVQMEDDESLEGQGRLITREIASAKHALGRVGNGSYGVCVQCGEDISENRLEVRPEAALCINCASKH